MLLYKLWKISTTRANTASGNSHLVDKIIVNLFQIRYESGKVLSYH